jgi:hypothetical protein
MHDLNVLMFHLLFVTSYITFIRPQPGPLKLALVAFLQNVNQMLSSYKRMLFS